MVHPKLLGIIKECGAKQCMREEDWKQARYLFSEAAGGYDECGISLKRTACFNYFMLANMLASMQGDDAAQQ